MLTAIVRKKKKTFLVYPVVFYKLKYSRHFLKDLVHQLLLFLIPNVQARKIHPKIHSFCNSSSYYLVSLIWFFSSFLNNLAAVFFSDNIQQSLFPSENTSSQRHNHTADGVSLGQWWVHPAVGWHRHRGTFRQLLTEATPVDPPVQKCGHENPIHISQK